MNRAFSIVVVFRLRVALIGGLLGWMLVSPLQGSDLDQEARRFRIHAYQSFQFRRPDYDRYVKALQTITRAYEARGKTDSDRRDLMMWLSRGIREPDLPPFPSWVERGGLQGAAASRRQQRWMGERVGPERTRPHRKEVVIPIPDLPNPVLTSWTAWGLALQTLPSVRLPDRLSKSPMVIQRHDRLAVAVPIPPEVAIVDVWELASLIHGYNETLRTLDGLVAHEKVWSLERLTDLVTELEELDQRRKIQATYVSVLSPVVAQKLPLHRSAGEVATRLMAPLQVLLEKKGPTGTTPRTPSAADAQVRTLQRRLEKIQRSSAPPSSSP